MEKQAEQTAREVAGDGRKTVSRTTGLRRLSATLFAGLSVTNREGEKRYCRMTRRPTGRKWRFSRWSQRACSGNVCSRWNGIWFVISVVKKRSGRLTRLRLVCSGNLPD
jgi:hypothetical protein